MDDVYFINNLEQLKVLCDPFRITILWALDEKPKTGKMLADEFNISPSKVRYHLKELEHVNLVKIVDTSVKNGIVQNFYQPIAKTISIEKMLPVINGRSLDFYPVFEKNAQLALDRSKKYLKHMSEEDSLSTIQITDLVSLSEQNYKFLKNKIKEIYHFLMTHQDLDGKMYHVNISMFSVSRNKDKREDD